MTAVEWLAEQLPIYGYNVVTVYPELIEQAKEMEKQQIIDACDNAQRTDFYVKYYDAEQYYNETFKNK